MRPPPEPVREGCALAAPVVLLWLLNRRALGFWWMSDDPCHLVQVFDDGIWRSFVDPVGNFLQPLLSLSLGIDFELFGLDPRAFYVHQLVSFTLFLGVAYAFLRCFLRPAPTALALALFVASTPAIAVAQQLMNRHYLEGFLLMLASLVCFRRSIAGGRWWLAVAGAGLYLLATAAKEVFVPMILLLPLVVDGEEARGGWPRWKSLGRWWRFGVPYLFALGFYGVWRLSMLGWDNSLWAYGSLSGDFHGDDLLRRMSWILGWTPPWQALGAVALLATAAWGLCRRSPGLLVVLGVVLAVVALPLIPVAGRLEPRHLLVAAFAATAMVAAALALPIGPARWRSLAGVGLLVLALFVSIRSSTWATLEKSSRQYRAEGSFVLDGSRDGMLLTRLPHSYYLQCLARLGRDVLGQTSGPGFCGDLCYCAQAFPDAILREEKDGRIVPVTRIAADSCDARRPLAVDMHHDAGRDRLSWELEPLDGGTYQALLLSDAGQPGVSTPIAIPPQGSLAFRLAEPLRFVLNYRSPDGWQTYSPVYVVEPGGVALPDEP